ncbi:MAG: Ldh family oxidoreductase [Lautropia sp.]
MDASDLARAVESLSPGAAVHPERLAEIAAAILVLSGLPPVPARDAADLLVEAQCRGIDSHGLAHLPAYVARLASGAIDPGASPCVVRTGPATARIDGRNGLGVLTALCALRTVCELAGAAGIGSCAVFDGNHFGAAAPLVERAARAGLIALVFSNAAPTMAPWGGRQPLLGTNPLAAAFPVAGGPPIVVDMATSAVARGRIRKADASGAAIPADWALDADGRPTTDPRAALAGTVQPLGGAKGYALALLVELLCTTLSGGRIGAEVRNPHDPAPLPAGTSHLFIALDPGFFAGLETAGAIAREWCDRIEASPAAVAGVPPRVPGRQRIAEAARRASAGIPVGKPLLDSLRQALRKLPAATGQDAA